LAVAQGRNMHVSEVENLAQGKVYTGRRAKELKLVDELGTFYDAIDIAKAGAHIIGKAKLIRVIKFEDNWFTVRAKVSEMLGLNAFNLKQYLKQDLVKFQSYLY
jgi:ClpP class serine protease